AGRRRRGPQGRAPGRLWRLLPDPQPPPREPRALRRGPRAARDRARRGGGLLPPGAPRAERGRPRAHRDRGARRDEGGCVMANLRAGLIGLGNMGRHHARVLREIDGVDLVAVADPHGDPWGAAGRLEGLPDVGSLLAAGGDRAGGATPTRFHEPLAPAPAEAGGPPPGERRAVADPHGDPWGAAGRLEVLPDVESLVAAGIDMAVVATPTRFHEPLALALAEAGVHTLVEKPVAADSAGGRRIAEAFEAAGLVG